MPADQSIRIHLNGVNRVDKTGTLITLHANDPEATNTISDPKNIIPVTTEIKGISKDFSHTFSGYSINVLKIETE